MARGPEGIPVLDGVPGWFAGRVLDRLDLGDHIGLWLEPFEARTTAARSTSGFQDRQAESSPVTRPDSPVLCST